MAENPRSAGVFGFTYLIETIRTFTDALGICWMFVVRLNRRTVVASAIIKTFFIVN
jgi:hypothetical protein